MPPTHRDEERIARAYLDHPEVHIGARDIGAGVKRGLDVAEEQLSLAGRGEVDALSPINLAEEDWRGVVV